MKTIERNVITTQTINKSIFITYLNKAETVEEAKNFISSIRLKHNDATHVVSAYLVGLTGEYGHYSDDGEPSKTAGLPVLDVFLKNSVTNFVACVVRYYGGIKLGAGGLVRAYSSSASLALKETSLVDIILYDEITFTIDYSYLNVINNYIKDYELINQDFSENVTLTIKVPRDCIKEIKDSLINITQNNIKIK